MRASGKPIWAKPSSLPFPARKKWPSGHFFSSAAAPAAAPPGPWPAKIPAARGGGGVWRPGGLRPPGLPNQSPPGPLAPGGLCGRYAPAAAPRVPQRLPPGAGACKSKRRAKGRMPRLLRVGPGDAGGGGGGGGGGGAGGPGGGGGARPPPGGGRRGGPGTWPGGYAAGLARPARPPPPPAGWHSAVCSWRKSVDARAKKTRNKLCLKGKKSRCVFEGM